ncbi:hypothetical protein [[Eubacterium] cellulosolvens]
MPDVIKVECKYCGSFIELSKAVKLNTETGEYEYLCSNCAIRFEDSDGHFDFPPQDQKPEQQ